MRRLAKQREVSSHEPGASPAILLRIIRELSLARTLDEIMRVVRSAARELVQADGATFVLRDGDCCFYAEEEAIAPLWKGMKFPLSACISGWAMLHREQLAIVDIYADQRIPHDVYRPTFVKSLAMTPIRQQDPLGAIGTYWAHPHRPSERELSLLQDLADATTAALRTCETMRELEQRLQQLENANHCLNRLTWMASHDLKEPIRAMGVRLSILEDQVKAWEGGVEIPAATQRREVLQEVARMQTHVQTAQQLVADLHGMSGVYQHKQQQRPIDLNDLIKECLETLRVPIHDKKAVVSFTHLPTVWADPVLLTRVFLHLIDNALKFQPDGATPRVEIRAVACGAYWEISIQDNGIGIDPAHHQNIFEFFKKVHGRSLFAGSGVGLALSKKIIEDCGGHISCDSTPGEGSRFYFTLPRNVQ